MFAPYSKAVAAFVTGAILAALAAIQITPGMTVEEAIAVIVTGLINSAVVYLAPKNTVK